MKRYKLYFATDMEIIADSPEKARHEALCGFLAGFANASNISPFLRLQDVTVMYVSEELLSYVPKYISPKKKKRIFGGLL